MSDLIQVKEQKGLFIHKYKNKVFYKNLWNTDSALLDARGLVTDRYGNIVSYPFTKIFNYKENNTTIDKNHLVLAHKKINGFMACCSIHKGNVLVSTTGSLESKFVDMAKEMLPLDKIAKLNHNMSYCFEICHPNDKHIIEEAEGAYLIGARLNVLGSKRASMHYLQHVGNLLGLEVPEYKVLLFSDLLDLVKEERIEGYVVYDLESNVVLKIKTPYYLILKFLARGRKFERVFSDDYKKHIDEEFYGLCEYLNTLYTQEYFSLITEQERLNILRRYYEL